MTDQSLNNRAREAAKLWLRRALQRADLEIGRGTCANRLVRTMDSRRIETLLDIGANVGQYAALTRSAGFGGRIISCEPLTGAFDVLSHRAARDNHWLVLNTAVGSQTGTATINVSENSFSSSLRDMTDAHLNTAPQSRFIATENVPVTTVRELVGTHRVEPSRTLMKIDTQGFEAEVLLGAGELIGQMSAIQLELSFIELYRGQMLYDALVAKMALAGYRIHALEPGISDPSGRMLQVDGLFVLRDDACRDA